LTQRASNSKLPGGSSKIAINAGKANERATPELGFRSGRALMVRVAVVVIRGIIVANDFKQT